MSGRNRLGGDEWRAALASNFNGLIPDYPPADDAPRARGRLAVARLGDVTAFHVAGNSQVLRRSAAWARRLPSDLLKVCIQRAGSATIEQGGREVTLTPGSMAIYDIDRPYGIRLDGEWRCSVIAFPRDALVASRPFLDAVMCRPTPVCDGPGSVLIPLVASAISSADSAGARPARRASSWGGPALTCSRPRWPAATWPNAQTRSGCKWTPTSRPT